MSRLEIPETNMTSRRATPEQRRERAELEPRFGKIGISAVAAAMRYQSDAKNPLYAPAKPSAIAPAASLLSRARHARSTVRMGWVGGAILVLACGGAAIRFITIGVYFAPPALLTRAELVTGLTLVILITSIMAAFVDRRLAEK